MVGIGEASRNRSQHGAGTTNPISGRGTLDTGRCVSYHDFAVQRSAAISREAPVLAKSLSPVKRHRQSLRRRDRNRVRRTAVRHAVRRAREVIESGTEEEAQAAVQEAGAILDRTAGKGVIHRNNAARRKSRLMRQLHSHQATSAEEKPKRRTRAAAGSKSKASKAGEES